MYYNKSKINKSIEKEKLSLIQLSQKKEKLQSKYCSNIEIIDNKTGEVKNLTYDFIQTSKDYYQNIVQRTKYLQNLNIVKSEKHIGFFITLTLPTQYHPYTNKNTNYNDKYDKDLSKNDGYKLLNQTFRKIQKDMYDNEFTKKITFDFIKVIEYHKSLTPHLHGVVWVPERLVKDFKEHLKNVFGSIKLKEIQTDKIDKVKYNKNRNIGRSEVEQIKDLKRVVPYLLKYIKKSLNPTNEKDFHLLNGWKKKNKIRTFTISNVSIPRFLYKKLYTNIGKKIDKTKEDFNILEELEKMSDIKVYYFNKDIQNTPTKIKKYGSSGGRYEVIVEVNKTDYITYKNSYTNYKKSFQKKDFNLSFILSDKEFFERDKEKFEDVNKLIIKENLTLYKIDKFIIYDKKKDKIIYNKNDFIFINNN